MGLVWKALNPTLSVGKYSRVGIELLGELKWSHQYNDDHRQLWASCRSQVWCEWDRELTGSQQIFQPTCDFCCTLCRQKIISVHSSHIYALDNHPNNLNIGNGAILPAQSQTLSLQMIHYWTKTAPVSAFWASSNQFKRQFSMIFPEGHFWAIFCHRIVIELELKCGVLVFPPADRYRLQSSGKLHTVHCESRSELHWG